jgi:putative acetyltransferase
VRKVTLPVILELWPGSYAVCRLGPAAAVPEWARRGRLNSITRTAAELSIVCDAGGVPPDVRAERGFRVVAVRGPLDLNLAGVLAGLTAPLAAAGISVFALATYDTDYLLVRQHDLDRALAALRDAGHDVANVTICREQLPSSLADQLIAELNAELTAMYPEPGATHFRLNPEEVSPGRGAFVVAFARKGPVGCGAVRRLDPETAELKRMYVVPSARGEGIGRALLDALEREARQLMVRRLVLETGIRQAAALALYERAGFERIPPYGEYTQSPETSVCMGKDLDRS